MNNAAQKKIRKQMQQEPLIMDFYRMIHKYDLQKEASEIFNKINPPKDKKGNPIKAAPPVKTDHAIVDDNPLVMIKGKVSEAASLTPNKKSSFDRPRNNVDITSLQTRLEDIENPPKKKVGRPRKETPVEVAVKTPAKKVGRPRKVEAVAATPEVPKRKVGRPAKIQAVEVVEKPKSNRGRPLCLKVARKKLGYTQAEMAKFLGISQALICLIEKKTVPMSESVENQLRALKNK